MSPIDEPQRIVDAELIANALDEHIHARIAEALMDAGRRSDPSLKTADLLTPVFISLLANPDVRQAAMIATARLEI